MMIRFVIRFVAMLTFAVGCAIIVIDGTRSIAANAILMTPLGTTWAALFPQQFARYEIMTKGLHPGFSGVVLGDVFALPAWLVLTSSGTFLFWLAYRRPPNGRLAD